MYLIKNVQIPLSRDYDLSEAVAEKFQIPKQNIGQIKILRKALDARKRDRVKFSFTLLAADMPSLKHPDLLPYNEPVPYMQSKVNLHNKNPFIIGAGPAGLFAALGFVERGFEPVIFDRGEALEQRNIKVNQFWQKGILDEESNVQFGEGGAGTFSDGKLTARNRDFYSNKIFSELIRFGADPEIGYEALPHLGTDKLKVIIKNIRQYLISKGCEFHWQHKLENLIIDKGRVTGVVINGSVYHPEIVLLATGNGARDTFDLLNRLNAVEQKPFAAGFRIEHSQEFIDEAFYGKNTDLTLTGPATYRLTAKHYDKGIYSFCMCPGGYVIGAATEKDHLVVNGMSFSDRSNQFANSAIVAGLDKQDLGSDVMAGIEFQKKIEARCYREAKGYNAPAQTAAGFLNGTIQNRKLSSTFLPGVNHIDISKCLPAQLVERLRSGLQQFEKKIPGFVKEGIIIAPETRTSSPVRITRDRNLYNSSSASNLYPIGEGSGYAGGIISSAVDGYKSSQIFYC